jgi:PI-3-kinase-related kinase SMG-1
MHKQEFDSSFNLNCSRLARKQTNFKLATRLLTTHLSNISNNANSSANIYEAVKSFMYETRNLSIESRMRMCDFEKETAKLLNVTDSNRVNSIEILASSITNHMDMLVYTNNTLTAKNTQANEEALNEKYARSILTLTKWLTAANQAELTKIVTTLNQPDLMSMNNKSLNQIELLCYNLFKILNNKPNGFDESKFNLRSRSDIVTSAQSGITSETCIGDLIDLATVLSPKLAKSWHSLGDWCYRLAKKSVDKLIVDTNHQNAPALVEDDFIIISDLLPGSASDEERAFIKRLFTRGLSAFNSINEQQPNERDSQIDFLFQSSANNLNSQLDKELFFVEARKMLVKNCQTLSLECVNSILNVYKNLINRVYYYYKISCKAYFSYLQYSAKDYEKSFEESNISVTLRILRLLVKYAIELKDDLQDGLATTPSQSWKNIIPQLFARLNHPEAYIRQSISKLLCRIARDHSHLIIYPAVVGSQDGPTKIQTVNTSSDTAKKATDNELSQQEEKQVKESVKEDEVNNENDKSDDNLNSAELEEEEEESSVSSNEIEDQEGEEQEVEVDNRNNREKDENEEDEEEEEEKILDDEKKVELKNTYKYLLDTLSETNPKVIEQVKLFVHEMRRITLLREELWYGTLNQIHSDINKRIEQLNLEIIKVTFFCLNINSDYSSFVIILNYRSMRINR